MNIDEDRVKKFVDSLEVEAVMSYRIWAPSWCPLYTSATTKKACREDMFGDLLALWGEFVEVDESTLGESGKELRRNLIENFGGETK